MNGDDLEKMRRYGIRICLLSYQHVLDIGDGFGPSFGAHAKMTYALSRIVSEQQPGVIADLPNSSILADILDLVEAQEDAVYANYQRDEQLAVLAQPLLDAHSGMFERAIEDLLREMTCLRKQISRAEDKHFGTQRTRDRLGEITLGMSRNNLRAMMHSRSLRRRCRKRRT